MPTKNPDKENRSVINQFRSTPSDRQYFIDQTEKAGISFSEYALSACRDGEIIINQRTALSYAEIDQVRRHGYNIMHLLKEYRTRGHPPPGNLEALFDVQQLYYKMLLDDALSEEPV